jgi:hypothetical protein
MAKLGARGRAQLVVIVYETGLVHPEPEQRQPESPFSLEGPGSRPSQRRGRAGRERRSLTGPATGSGDPVGSQLGPAHLPGFVAQRGRDDLEGPGVLVAR